MTVASYNISNAQYLLQEAFPNLSFQNAVDLQHAGDGTDRIFIVEQAGVIKVFQNNSAVTQSKVFLDITDRVSSGGEMGLLGLAFHPNYETNGFFYVNYTVTNPRYTRISRFSVSSSNPDSADNNSELILMSIEQPYSNHNGGQLSFGPDNFLYIALGDGGSQGDPDNQAQNKSSWLGKILRIDVNSTQGNLNYSIPVTNPFAGNTQGYKEEIYALGFRNPWRFSFDFETNRLWCADVGQWTLEEIDIVESGKNYGWRCYEGNIPYDLTDCNDIYESPIWVYPRSEGYSVTGGYVYRGPNLPGLYGKYIYSDYGSKKVWALEYDGINEPSSILLLTAAASPVSFGVDQNNELYICAFSGSNDKIFRFTPTAAIIAPSNLNASAVSSGEIELSWNDNSVNESGFIIERKTASSNFAAIDSVGADQSTYIDINLNPGEIYTYRVYAYSGGTFSGYSNSATVAYYEPLQLSQLTVLIEGMYDGSAMMTDTVLVQLRNSFYPHSLVDQTNVPLNSDGLGSGVFTSAMMNTPYYLAIKHRNAIETWSNSTISFTNNFLVYDFTSSQSAAFGNNLVEVNGRWCIYSGDVNQDGYINFADVQDVFIDNINGETGYNTTDVNGDGLTEILDLGIVYKNSVQGVEIRKPFDIDKAKDN